MSGEAWLGVVSLFCTTALGVLVWNNQRRQAHAGERSVDIDEQTAEISNEDKIAERRRVELERLYLRVEKLEGIVERLQQADEDKQKTIDSQADELGRTNDLLSDLRSAFKAFVERVEKAWDDGHSRPSLTDEERSLLENTIPRNRLFKE
jgi:Mg2+ and Co2+ transporter CorA